MCYIDKNNIPENNINDSIDVSALINDDDEDEILMPSDQFLDILYGSDDDDENDNNKNDNDINEPKEEKYHLFKVTFGLGIYGILMMYVINYLKTF